MAVTTLKRMAGNVGMARDAYRLRSSDQEHVRAQVRSHLISRMGKMRGLPQKLGQMLSFSEQSTEEDSAEQFSVLQEQADVKQRIARQGIDLAQIVSSVRRGGYAPTQIFELVEGAKHIEVWLE